MTRADIETTRLRLEQLALHAKDIRAIFKRDEELDQRINPHRAMAIFFLSNAVDYLDMTCQELVEVSHFRVGDHG